MGAMKSTYYAIRPKYEGCAVTIAAPSFERKVANKGLFVLNAALSQEELQYVYEQTRGQLVMIADSSL